jgi:hypothetical protein
MHRQRYLLVFLVVSLLSSLMISAAPYQTTGNSEHRVLKLSDLGVKSDETFVGIHVDRVYSVRWPEAWKPESGNTLTLYFSHSKALAPSSSVVVDWNGTRLSSTLLTSNNTTRGILSIPIPEGQIQTGYNELRIEFYMGIHDNFCDDIDNPAIWATVHSDSTLDLSYSKVTPELNLGKFPYPFLDSSDLIENQVTIVTPEQPSAAELTAISTISAKLGQKASYRVLTLNALSDQDAATQNGHLIYVGLADRLPILQTWDLPFAIPVSGKTRLVDASNKVIPDGVGVLWEQISPTDPTSVAMIVTAETDAGLLKAAASLANDAAYQRLSGQLGYVVEVPKPEVSQSPVGQVLTFKDLGYADVTARGVRDQTMNFNIPLPLAWQIKTEIVLELHFAHSALLDGDKSAMNVSLNGSPVSNIMLTKDNAEDAWATFRLPARLFTVGDNKLTIKSTIQLKDGYHVQESCGENYIDEAWVVVYFDSRVNLPNAPAGMVISLADYPQANIGDASLSQLGLIVPDKTDLSIAQAVARISARLGRYTNAAALSPTVQTAQSAVAAQPGLPVQILIGLTSENGAIQKINEMLPLPINPGTNQVQPHPKVPIVVSGSGATGYVEVTQTVEGNPRLVVSGTSAQAWQWAVDVITNPKMIGRLKGDVAFVQGPEEIVTAQIREAKAVVINQPEAVPTQQAPRPVDWVLWAAYGVIGLTILIIVIVWVSEFIRQRQAKKTYEI